MMVVLNYYRIGVSLVELKKAVGTDVKGNLALERRRNLILTVGITEQFARVLRKIEKKLIMKPSSALVYMTDGELYRLPLARRDKEYSTPHWLPVTFDLKDQRPLTKENFRKEFKPFQELRERA